MQDFLSHIRHQARYFTLEQVEPFRVPRETGACIHLILRGHPQSKRPYHDDHDVCPNCRQQSSSEPPPLSESTLRPAKSDPFSPTHTYHISLTTTCHLIFILASRIPCDASTRRSLTDTEQHAPAAKPQATPPIQYVHHRDAATQSEMAESRREC